MFLFIDTIGANTNHATALQRFLQFEYQCRTALGSINNVGSQLRIEPLEQLRHLPANLTIQQHRHLQCFMSAPLGVAHHDPAVLQVAGVRCRGRRRETQCLTTAHMTDQQQTTR